MPQPGFPTALKVPSPMILDEEAFYLFDGSKTAEEVAKITQNRVQLYLDEG